MITDPDDPFGRTVFETLDSSGDIIREIAPGQYVCDFCMEPDPTWSYPCGRIVVVGSETINGSDDPWAACDRCHELIEAGDVEAMVAEMVERQRERPLAPGWVLPSLKRQRAAMDANLRAFLAARQGPARAL